MTSPALLVFADVDETLIDCKSMFDFLDFYLAHRYGADGVRRAQALRDSLLAQAAAGVPREETNRTYYQVFRGERAVTVADSARQWFADRSIRVGFFHESTRTALREHRAAGGAVVLVSGSFPAVLEPIAAAVGADHVLCTRPEVRDGLMTGRIVGEPVIGEGKRRAVRALYRRYPWIDPADCYGYGDHVSDLPMLEEVGHPVVVGGNVELIRQLEKI